MILGPRRPAAPPMTTREATGPKSRHAARREELHLHDRYVAAGFRLALEEQCLNLRTPLPLLFHLTQSVPPESLLTLRTAGRSSTRRKWRRMRAREQPS